MLYQTDKNLGTWINSYGCFFMVVVFWFAKKLLGVERSVAQVLVILVDCLLRGVISIDKNYDGDLDDAGEGEIQGKMPNGKDGKDELARLAGLKLKYAGRKEIGTFIPNNSDLYVGEFYNEATKFRHFVGVEFVNGKWIVVYDPIPGSRTVREGKLVAVRIFKKVD